MFKISDSHTNRWVQELNERGECVNPRKVYVGFVGMMSILNMFGPFDFINIDIEGYSAQLVLQDCFNPLQHGCKLICIEHDSQIRELRNKFHGYGYKELLLNSENLIFGL